MSNIITNTVLLLNNSKIYLYLNWKFIISIIIISKLLRVIPSFIYSELDMKNSYLECITLGFAFAIVSLYKRCHLDKYNFCFKTFLFDLFIGIIMAKFMPYIVIPALFITNNLFSLIGGRYMTIPYFYNKLYINGHPPAPGSPLPQPQNNLPQMEPNGGPPGPSGPHPRWYPERHRSESRDRWRPHPLPRPILRSVPLLPVHPVLPEPKSDTTSIRPNASLFDKGREGDDFQPFNPMWMYRPEGGNRENAKEILEILEKMRDENPNSIPRLRRNSLTRDQYNFLYGYLYHNDRYVYDRIFSNFRPGRHGNIRPEQVSVTRSLIAGLHNVN